MGIDRNKLLSLGREVNLHSDIRFIGLNGIGDCFLLAKPQTELSQFTTATLQYRLWWTASLITKPERESFQLLRRFKTDGIPCLCNIH